MSEPIPLITPKGDINQAWSEAYMAETGCTFLVAHEQLQLRIADMPEPPLTTGRGVPNPVWVTRYRVRKRVSTNIARNACKKLILAEQQGTDHEKIRQDLHRRVSW